MENSKHKQLQQKAEKILKAKEIPNDFQAQKDDIVKLFTEILGQQIELEKQNDKLLFAQRELQNKKQKYQDLYDHAPIAYLTLDKMGNIIQLNFEAARMLGRPREEFKSYAIFSLLEQESKNLCRSMIKNTFLYGGETGELTFLDQDRNPIFTKVQLLIYLEKEIYKELCWLTITDITKQIRANQALQESEGKFRSFVENANDIVYTLNEKGKFLYVSPNVKDILGYESKEIIGKDLSPITHPEDIPICINALQEIINTKKKKSGVEFRAINSSGEWCHFITNVSPLLDKAHNLIAVLGISHDMTEKIKILQELHELNVTKDKFFSIISHDLKNPIGSIVNVLESLLQNPKDLDSSIELLQKMVKQTYSFIEDLLLWARLQTNKISLNPTTIDMHSLIHDLILFQKYVSADKKKINIRTNLHDEKLKVFADLEMIKIVLRNLLSNAVKFTNPGGEVILGSQTLEYSKILFYVADNGIGISEENQNKLFRLDQNFSTNGTNNENGTGLGLILCKEFIERNGGTISVESKKGKGSKFSFTLDTIYR